MVTVEVASSRQGFNTGKSDRWCFGHGECDGAVQRDDWRTLASIQLVIQGHNGAPVGLFGTRSSAVLSGDCGLKSVWSATAPESLIHKWERLGDLCVIPTSPVLILEQDDVARLIGTGVTSRVVQEHECEQSQRLGGRIGRH